MIWDWAFVLNIMPSMLVGVWYTILVTVVSSAIALGGGLALALLESVSTTVGRIVVRIISEVFRGVPVVVILYFGFYVLPEMKITLSNLAVGIAVLGIVYASYCSEVYRGSLITIPGELRDACVALGLSPAVTWRRILIPLMIRRSAPPLISYVINLFRATAWLFAIGVPVLMGEAEIIAEETFRYLEAFTVAGALYMMLNLPLLYLLYRFKAEHD